MHENKNPGLDLHHLRHRGAALLPVLVGVLVLALLAAPAVLAEETESGSKTSEEPGIRIDYPLRFETLSVEDGLSQSMVNCIYQDRMGFTWIGTQDGLNRFDGYEFKVFRHLPGDADTLNSSWITTVLEDREGYLWVGTHEAGLNRYDPQKGVFTHYLSGEGEEREEGEGYLLRIQAILEDRSGNLWVVRGFRIFRLTNREAGTFEPYDLGKEIDIEDLRSVNAFFYEDRNGILWAGVERNLYRYDAARDSFVSYELKNSEAEFEGFPFFMFETRPGVLHLEAVSGAYNYDPEKDAFVLEPPRGDQGWRRAVSSGYLQSPDTVWIGMRGHGLIRVSTENEEYSQFYADPNVPDGLGGNNVSAILVDRTGVLWVGTMDRGLSKADLNKGVFAHFNHSPYNDQSLMNPMVWSIYEDGGGILWVGTYGGLNRVDRSKKTVERIPFDREKEEGFRGGSVQCITEDHGGNLWVGTMGGGLYRFDRDSKEFTTYREDSEDPNSICDNRVLDFQVDRQGGLWVATGDGLCLYRPESDDFEVFREDEKNPSTKGLKWLRELYGDQNGDIWIGSQGQGLLKLNPKNHSFTRFEGDPDNPKNLGLYWIHAIHEDPAGVLWVGTFGGGLYRVDMNNQSCIRYTQADGLPNDVLYGILGDREGRLWISTNEGLCRFDPTTETFRTFEMGDGLQSNEFNSSAYFKSKSGEMFFGGINGFNAFYPEKITDNPIPPPVVLTEFKLANTPVPVGGDSPLQRPIFDTKDISLSFREKILAFEYVALHFSNPGRNQYAYMMEGFEEDWNYVGDRRFAIYTNLPPGKYTFRVKASNGDDIWNETGTSLDLTILPPWWRTAWAYGFYFFAGFGLLFGIRQVERNRERQKAILTESELRAQAAELQSRVAEAQSRALQSENERKSAELEQARDMQLAMLAKSIPMVPHLDIAVSTQTATEVGGDYYDFRLDDDGSLLVAIGDATGHGSRAGVMVAVMKGLFSTLSENTEIQDFFDRANRILCRMQLDSMYMAMQLLKFRGYSIQASAAAMPPFLIYRAATKEVEEVPIRGMFLGFDLDIPFDYRELEVLPGDTILLMSDGFPELFNENEETLGMERTRGLFAEVAHRSPREILAHLREAGDNWRDGRPQGDDITFVVLKAKETLPA